MSRTGLLRESLRSQLVQPLAIQVRVEPMATGALALQQTS
jgi:hypothetical protein